MELSAQQRNISYVILTVTWLAIGINLLYPLGSPGVQQALYWAGIGMSVAHAVEVFLYLPRVPARVNRWLAIVLIFFFGIVYASQFPAENLSVKK